MEDPTSFELNQAIRGWQDGLRHSPHFREEDLTELETHVRDAVATFQAKGLAEDEAFLLATRRLGEASRLEPEFAKVNRAEVWLNRLLWMLIGVQAWGLLRELSGVLSRAVVVGGLWGLGFHVQSGQLRLDWGRGVLVATFMSLAYLLVLAGLLGGCWRIIRKERDADHFLARALRRPVFLGVVVTFTLLVVYSLRGVENFLFTRYCSMTEFARLSFYQMVSGSLLTLAQTVAFVALTIALLRRFRGFHGGVVIR